MTIDCRLIVAVAAVTLTAAACSAGGAGPGNPRAGAASLPGVTCSAGTANPTTYATAAQSALNRTLVLQGDARTPFYQQALEQARQGITAEPGNALHYFLAGQSYVGLNDLAGADSVFDRAVQICPEFAGEVTPAREQAWAQAFQTGLDAYQAGDTARAIATWEAAGNFYSDRADVFYNLAVVYGQRGDYAQAVANYQKALESLDRTPNDTVQAVIQAEAETRANALNGLLSAGAQLFGQDRFTEAAQIFTVLNRLDPNNRDAWYNHALALYKQERWEPLIPVAQRLTQIDPLNYNGQIILFNAYKGRSEAAKARNDAATERTNRDLALRTLEAADALPVQVDGVSLTNQDGSVQITGQVTGGAARAGSPVQLEFTIYGPAGTLGTQTVSISAPAKDAKANFELTVPTTTPATSWSYRLVR